jgi:hypothetical protein
VIPDAEPKSEAPGPNEGGAGDSEAKQGTSSAPKALPPKFPPCRNLIPPSLFKELCGLDVEYSVQPTPTDGPFDCRAKVVLDSAKGEFISIVGKETPANATESDEVWFTEKKLKPKGRSLMVGYTQGGLKLTLQETSQGSKLRCGESGLRALAERVRRSRL